MDYFWEKLYLAVSTLASGDSPLRERLVDAWISSLVNLQDHDVPAEVLPRFNALRVLATSQSARNKDEGTIHASIAQLDELEARQMVEEIISLYNWVCHMRGPEWVS